MAYRGLIEKFRRDLVDVFGSAYAGFIDGILKGVYNKDAAFWTGKFPFIPTIDPLPSLDDWIVLFASLGLWGVGKIIDNRLLEDAGVAASISSVGMLTEATIRKARSMIVAAYSRPKTAARPATQIPAPQLETARTLVSSARVSAY